MTPKIVLASSSPRRIELLKKLGLEFKVVTPIVEEKHIKGESPLDFAIRTSREKAFSVSSKLNGDYIVIGADTIVVIDKVIIGKPRDETEAKSMLLRLSG
ncbi:MAG: Maf family protein, partial [Thermodesulfobacteriota bacterium]